MNSKLIHILFVFFLFLATEAKSEIIPIKVFFDNDWIVCKPSDAAYYRISQWDSETKSYEGKFTDYSIDNTVIAEGNYSRGEKSGVFTFNYENGSKKITAYFKDNKPDGLWIWYYPDKSVHFKIDFNQEEFNFVELYNKNGKSLLEKYKFSYKFRNDKLNTKLKIEGNLKGGRKEGKWKIINNKESLGFDLYEKGNLLKTKFHNPSILVVSERLIRNSLFTPYSIYACENPVLSDNVSDIDYPFLSHLSPWLPIKYANGLIGDSTVFILDQKPRYLHGQEGIDRTIGKNIHLTKNVNDNCKSWGTVYYELTIDEEGFVIGKKIIKSPDDLLNDVALKALEHLGPFKPAYLNQKPIKSKFISKIKFTKPFIIR